MAENQFYPSLSELIPTHKIPASLGTLKTNVENVLHKIFYKEFIAEVNHSGDTASYKTTLVLYNRIDIEIFGSGVFLVINPGRPVQSTTDIPISLGYSWPIKRYIGDIQDLAQNFDALELFNIILEIIDIEPSELLMEVVSVFINDTDPIQRLITDINGKYFTPPANPGGTPIPTISGSVFEIIEGVLDHLESHGIDIYTLIFDDYLFSVNSFDTILLNLKQLFNKWFGDFSLEDLKDLITPQVNVSLDEIKFAIEFPRSTFQPFATTGLNTASPLPIGTLLPDTFKTQLIANIGSVSFNSKTGFSIDDNINFNFDRSLITGTGFVVEFNGLKVDINENRNIPEADADGRPVTFKGIYADTAKITLPPFWGTSIELEGTNILIGNPDGLSGHIKLNIPLSTNLFGLDISLSDIDVTFKQNRIEASTITGTIKFPDPDYPNDPTKDQIITVTGGYTNDDGLGGDGESNGFFISATTPANDPVKIRVGSLLEINLSELTFTRNERADSFEIKIVGAVVFLNRDIPLVGDYLPESIIVNELLIDSETGISNIDLGLKWTNKSNTVAITAGANSVEVDVNVNFNEGEKEDLLFFALHAALINKGASGTDLRVTMDGNLKLGFATAAFKGFGIESTITTVNDGTGDLGPLKFSAVGVIFPNGIGIKINSEKVKGGGFLSIDKEKGLFTGALELSVANKFSVTAIGILATKLPSGEKGFSLLVIINFVFSNGIQLGYGFTLNGLGGLLGINRSANTDALRANVSTGAVGKVLFPEDPVGNITALLADLQSFFPIQEDRYLIGFMARIKYAGLITGDLGIILEVPSPVRILLLGSIKCQLPDPSNVIVQLRIDFLGVIEFDPFKLFFDASLIDSRIAKFTLTGDFAMRLIAGSNPNFLLTAGGFHPEYTPPELSLPPLRRISIALSSGDKLQLSATTYFALTSNSVQFGAGIYALAKAGKASAEGSFNFDALFYFQPFRFAISISVSFAIKYGNTDVCSGSASLKLTGPTPWTANGEVSFKFIKINYSVSFNKQWGDEATTQALPNVEVYPLLKAALTDNKGWVTELQTSDNFVTYQDIESDTDIILGPSGTFQLRQSVVPFNLTISRFGDARPTDAVKRFRISKITVGGVQVTNIKYSKDYFAASLYKELSESERIKSKSFEKFDNGADLTAVINDVRTGNIVNKLAEYEHIIIDGPFIPTDTGVVLPPVKVPAVMHEGFARSNSASSTVFSAANHVSAADSFVRVAESTYQLVDANTLQPISSNTDYVSYTQAQEKMAEMIQSDPLKEEQLLVIATHELV